MSAAKHTPGVIALMASVDDHLQAMQHYGHGHDQREAMGIVQEMFDALRAVYINAVSLPGLRNEFSVDRATLEKVGAVFDKAGSAV